MRWYGKFVCVAWAHLTLEWVNLNWFQFKLIQTDLHKWKLKWRILPDPNSTHRYSKAKCSSEWLLRTLREFVIYFSKIIWRKFQFSSTNFLSNNLWITHSQVGLFHIWMEQKLWKSKVDPTVLWWQQFCHLCHCLGATSWLETFFAPFVLEHIWLYPLILLLFTNAYDD